MKDEGRRMKFRIAERGFDYPLRQLNFARQLKEIIDRESRDRNRSAEDEWQEDTDHRCTDAVAR